MARLPKLMTAVATLLVSVLAFAQGRVECNALSSAILQHPVRYCVLLPAGYDLQRSRTYPVLYFLHGLGGDEQALINSGGWNIAEQLRNDGKIGDLLIAVPDGGASFYINSRDGRVRYEDFFIREFIPAIERKYRATSTRAGRVIAGVSMGGYGGLRFAFKYPQMFAAVAVQMPALYERLPAELADAAVSRARQLSSASAFGSPPDDQFWRRNSPLTLARADAAQLHHLKIYFDCGDRDEYGFDVGARNLDRILKQEGITHEFHIYPGHHNWSYVAEHFGEILQFEWKALSSEKSIPGGATGRK